MIHAVLVALVCFAPAPFPTSRIPPTLQARQLVGEWDMRWAGSLWKTTLSPGGHYSSKCNSVTFIGSWHVKEGCLWITESSHPEDAESWKHYKIRLSPSTLEGKIESDIHANFSVGFERSK